MTYIKNIVRLMGYETPPHLESFKTITALRLIEDTGSCKTYDTYGCEGMQDVIELQEELGGEWSIFIHGERREIFK